MYVGVCIWADYKYFVIPSCNEKCENDGSLNDGYYFVDTADANQYNCFSIRSDFVNDFVIKLCIDFFANIFANN